MSSDERERLTHLAGERPGPYDAGENVVRRRDGIFPTAEAADSEAAELIVDALNALPRLLSDLDVADEHIEFLSSELKARENKLNQKGGELKAKRERIAELTVEVERAERRGYEKAFEHIRQTIDGFDREDSANTHDFFQGAFVVSNAILMQGRAMYPDSEVFRTWGDRRRE